MNKSTFELMQVRAVDILLEETFLHINAIVYEKYQALGKMNAKLCSVPGVGFIHKGIVYPLGTTTSTRNTLPTLHYSLISELDTINNLTAQADYYYVKNFFIACISQSSNGIVLDNLLPLTLVNALKQALPQHIFKMIDTGVYDDLKQEPLSITQQNIQKIKEHYATTISTIRNLLMDKLLLQS